jgi:hypothetical protein
MDHETTAGSWSMVDLRPWGHVTALRLGRSEVVMIAHTHRERERSSLGFSPIVPLGGRVAETATRRCSIEAASGAPMGRWFRARGGEIGAGVDAVDNGGALIAPFIGA